MAKYESLMLRFIEERGLWMERMQGNRKSRFLSREGGRYTYRLLQGNKKQIEVITQNVYNKFITSVLSSNANIFLFLFVSRRFILWLPWTTYILSDLPKASFSLCSSVDVNLDFKITWLGWQKNFQDLGNSIHPERTKLQQFNYYCF